MDSITIKCRKERMPRVRRRPWFRCLGCSTRLAQMDVVGGRTCVRVSSYAVSYRIELTCERCGMAREFVSMVVK